MPIVKDDLSHKVTAKQKRLTAPKWLECTWLRITCWKKSCPICSLLIEERQKMLRQGERDEFILDVLDDLRYNIADAFLSIAEIQKDAKRGRSRSRFTGRQSSPRRFPLYRALGRWHDQMHSVFNDGDELSSFWVETADAADLDWYTHVLLDYTSRLLLYQAGISAKEWRRSDVRAYMRFVIKKIIELVFERLNALAMLDSSEKGSFMLLLSRFTILRTQILAL